MTFAGKRNLRYLKTFFFTASVKLFWRQYDEISITNFNCLCYHVQCHLVVMFFLLIHVTLMMWETNLMHPLMKRLKQNRQWTIIMTFRSIQSATSTRFIFIIPSMQFTVKASLQIDFPWRVGNKICRATTTKIHRCAFEHKLNDLTEAWKDEAQKRMREKKLSSTYFPNYSSDSCDEHDTWAYCSVFSSENYERRKWKLNSILDLRHTRNTSLLMHCSPVS